MKRRKLAVLVLLICIGLLLISATAVLMRTSPSDLLFRFTLVRYILEQKLSQQPMPPPSEIFRKYVMNPIPESVTNIKVDKASEFYGYTYTLRFRINRADIALLIDSRPFERVWNVRYEDGCLDWAWNTWSGFSLNGVSISLYGAGIWRREPMWFKPELWDNPEAYAFYRVGDQVNIKALEYERKAYDRTDIQVLLYNENEGQAYFIVSHKK